MAGWLEDVAEVGSDMRFGVCGRVTDFSQRRGFYKCQLLDGQRHHWCRERVSPVLEGQATVLIVMRDVGFVVHDQKLPEGHVFHLVLVFSIVLQ